ncbi:unnamed protein product [Hymenolepis diminuta]|uniref:Uncharacterized protein n=1 Tax=Hymenolepis diminuta TaxID=6216 RepID=A0A3P7BCR6_HYMDI|nr:unnamed protein product [Hymenolepis diminuta]
MGLLAVEFYFDDIERDLVAKVCLHSLFPQPKSLYQPHTILFPNLF